MPGPYYSLRDTDLVLAGTEQTAPREYPVWGAPPMGGTLASEGMVYDSLPLLMALEHARGLEYALDGTENDGHANTPIAGHTHNTDFIAAMPWCQIESYRFTTLQHGPASTHVGFSYIVDSTSYIDVAFIPLAIRGGVSFVVPRLWVAFAAAAGNTLTIKMDLYDSASMSSVAVSLGEVSKAAESTTFDGYLETDARGFDASAVTQYDSLSLVFLRVQAKVSSGVAGLRQIQLLGSDQGYVAFPIRATLDTADAQGDSYLTREKLTRLFLTNATKIRQLCFGTTYALPARSRAHDHGEGRGEHIPRHLTSVMFGPHVGDGTGATSGGTVGVPLYTPTAGTSFATTPKLLVRQPFFVPGAYSKIKAILAGKFSGVTAPRTATIRVEVRPMREDFSTSSAANGIADAAILSTATDGFAWSEVELDLEPLGSVGQDRIYELLLWQESDPAATETYRLCGLCVYESGPATESALTEDLRRAPRETVAPTQINSGTDVTQLLTSRLHNVLNQLALESLGGVQGWQRTMQSTNPSKPWRRLVGRHQHRGSYTDSDGTLVDDGAIIRTMLMCQLYLQNVAGSGTEATSAGSSPPLGRQIHTTSNLSSWPEFEAWITLPQGLTAFDLYGLIQPGTNVSQARLYCSLLVNSNDIWDDDQTIVTNINGAGVEMGDNASTRLGSTSYRYTEVLPQESLAWVRNEQRLRRGLGVWTTDALKRAVLNADKLTTNPARWTEAIRVEVAPTYSGTHMLRVQWALQTGTPQPLDDGTYATGARLLAMCAVPSRAQ